MLWCFDGEPPDADNPAIASCSSSRVFMGGVSDPGRSLTLPFALRGVSFYATHRGGGFSSSGFGSVA